MVLLILYASNLSRNEMKTAYKPYWIISDAQVNKV